MALGEVSRDLLSLLQEEGKILTFNEIDPLKRQFFVLKTFSMHKYE